MIDRDRIVVVVFGRLAEGNPRWLSEDDRFGYHRYDWSILERGKSLLPDRVETAIAGDGRDDVPHLVAEAGAWVGRSKGEFLEANTWHQVAQRTKWQILKDLYFEDLMKTRKNRSWTMNEIINALIENGPMTTTEIRDVVGGGSRISQQIIRACKSKSNPIMARALTDEDRATHACHSRSKNIYYVPDGTAERYVPGGDDPDNIEPEDGDSPTDHDDHDDLVGDEDHEYHAREGEVDEEALEEEEQTLEEVVGNRNGSVDLPGHQAVRVTWTGTSTIQGWVPPDAAKTLRPKTHTTFGILLKETDEYLTIAPHTSDDGHFCHPISIPSVSVVEYEDVI